MYHGQNSHHDLPCIDRQISIVEAPVKLLVGNGLIGGVVVGAEVLVGEGVSCGDTLLGVENEHPLEEVDGCIFGQTNISQRQQSTHQNHLRS